MPLDPQLLAILACPEDKGPLYLLEAEDALYNPRQRRRYAIRDGIPVLLVDESEVVDEAEHRRLLALIAEHGIAPSFTPAGEPPQEGG